MNFELHLTKSAEKDLTKLRGLAEEAVRAILALKQNPYLFGPSAESFSVGSQGFRIFSQRSGLSGCLYSTGRR